MTALVIIAKEPLPGRAKTRLHPPLSLAQAAELASAAIDDTLAAMELVPATRRILLFEGRDIPPGAQGYEVRAQSPGSLDTRLAAVFDALAEPVVLIGMDTPHITARDLEPAFGAWPDDIDAWIGPADDGGFWALGMRLPRGDLIRGVPMSRDDTGRIQMDRLVAAGLTVATLKVLRDVDVIDDARAVAAIAPHTSFARRLTEFSTLRVDG